MNTQEKEKIISFFEMLSELENEDMMRMVDQHLDDEGIEIFIDFIEEFYGVESEEELGTLAQIMITGYLAGKAIENKAAEIH